MVGFAIPEPIGLARVCAGVDDRNEAEQNLASKRSDIDVCRTIQVTGRGWTLDETKCKRSQRIVELQNFVERALKICGRSNVLEGKIIVPRLMI